MAGRVWELPIWTGSGSPDGQWMISNGIRVCMVTRTNEKGTVTGDVFMASNVSAYRADYYNESRTELRALVYSYGDNTEFEFYNYAGPDGGDGVLEHARPSGFYDATGWNFENPIFSNWFFYIQPFDSYEEAYNALLQYGETCNISYMEVNCNLTGPAVAFKGETVTANISLQQGMTISDPTPGASISLYDSNGYIPFEYSNQRVTFTVPV